MAPSLDTLSGIGNVQSVEHQPHVGWEQLAKLFDTGKDLGTISEYASQESGAQYPYSAGAIVSAKAKPTVASMIDIYIRRVGRSVLDRPISSSLEVGRVRVVDSAIGQPTTELNQLADRVMQADWDGAGATALSPETIGHATELLESLPASLEPPDVDATVQGEIIFSWDSEDLGDTFDVAMREDGQMVMAGVFDGLKLKGTVNPKKEKTLSRLADLIRWTMQ